MDLEELFPSKPDDPLAQLVKQDLDPLSVDELRERIEALEGEIAALHDVMASPDFYRQSGDRIAAEKKRLEDLEARLAATYERWEELSAREDAAR